MTEINKELPLADQPVVWLGVREARDGKKLYAWFCRPSLITSGIAIDTLEDLASPFDFPKNKLPKTIGGIYTCPVRLEGERIQSLAPTFKFTGDKIIRQEIVAGCEARDHAARVAQRARKIEADMSKDASIAKMLNPLKRSYMATDTIGRLALEVVILAELRKGRVA